MPRKNPGKPPAEWIDDAAEKIKSLDAPALKAEAYARLWWRCRDILPDHSADLFGYASSGRHRRVEAKYSPKSERQNLSEIADPKEMRLWEIYWSLEDHYGRNERWNGSNLKIELGSRGAKILPKLTLLFATPEQLRRAKNSRSS